MKTLKWNERMQTAVYHTVRRLTHAGSRPKGHIITIDCKYARAWNKYACAMPYDNHPILFISSRLGGLVLNFEGMPEKASGRSILAGQTTL
jgi:hypothetical protein